MTIAIFGATGQLRGLTIDALLERGRPGSRLLALGATPSGWPLSPVAGCGALEADSEVFRQQQMRRALGINRAA